MQDIGVEIDVSTLLCGKRILEVPGVAALLSVPKSPAQIATIYGVSRQAVHQFIERNADALSDLLDTDKLMTYKLQHVTHRIIDSIDDSDLQKANLSTKMIAAGIAIDKSRLLLGQSTQNISTMSRYILDIEAHISSSAPVPSDPATSE